MTAVVRQIVVVLIELISLLLLVRAIFSWFPDMRNNRFFEIVYAITEPVLMPYRMLFERLNIGRNFPLDLSFLATILTLQFISMII